MSATRIGGLKTKAHLTKDEPDYYARVGKLGGLAGRGPNYKAGFAAGEVGVARARAGGSIGGARSKRGMKLTKVADGYLYYTVKATGEVVKYNDWTEGV